MWWAGFRTAGGVEVSKSWPCHQRFPWWPDVIPRVLTSKSRWWGQGAVMRKPLSCHCRCEDGRRTVGTSRSWKRQKRVFWSFHKGGRCDAGLVKCVGTSVLQNFQKINLCWFKSPSLWQFVTTAMGGKITSYGSEWACVSVRICVECVWTNVCECANELELAAEK